MKTYTREERDAALEKLPKPVFDFLAGETLSNIYLGIQKKNGLNLRQLDVLARITNTTLLGLEPESTLETNLHQALPELPNQQTRELVADINDRVFKEARRRLAENVLEPSGLTASTEKRPPEELEAEHHSLVVDSMRDDNPELKALYEKEKAEREAKRQAEIEADKALVAKLKKEEEEARQAAAEAAKATPAPEKERTGTIQDLMPPGAATRHTTDVSARTETTEEKLHIQTPQYGVGGQTQQPPRPQTPTQQEPEQPVSPTPTAPSIAEQKLKAPSVATPTQTTTQKLSQPPTDSQTPAPNTSTPPTPTETTAATPTEEKPPVPSTPELPAQEKPKYKGTDPYREQI